MRYQDAWSETAMPERELTLMTHEPSAVDVAMRARQRCPACACTRSEVWMGLFRASDSQL